MNVTADAAHTLLETAQALQAATERFRI